MQPLFWEGLFLGLTFGAIAALFSMAVFVRRLRRLETEDNSDDDRSWDRESALKLVLRLGLAKTGDEAIAQARAVESWIRTGD